MPRLRSPTVLQHGHDAKWTGIPTDKEMTNSLGLHRAAEYVMHRLMDPGCEAVLAKMDIIQAVSRGTSNPRLYISILP